ncbi:helix-turn-helix domain-containing protein [Flavobacteriaceae bacterium Ap0902]|nr:helix-turn-helix domain-containing protein [Flavobacteriaceae bacterium Ap0902]
MYKKIIEEILSVYNLNATELAEKIGVQRSGISHILSGRNNPSIDFLIKVKDEFADIQWDYLIKGEGPMFVTNVNKAEKMSTQENIQPKLFSDAALEGSNPQKQKKPQQVKKIVWFYGDDSFEVFYPLQD